MIVSASSTWVNRIQVLCDEVDDVEEKIVGIPRLPHPPRYLQRDVS